jgi:hypothetical protein
LPTTSNNGVSGTWAPGINNQNTTTYTFTPTAGSCATTATTTVTVKQTTSSNSSANVCATSLPYIWNGISCASAGSYTKVFAGGNAVGCDSTAYLTLTVNTTPTAPSFTQVAAICAGGSFTLPSTSNNGVNGSWAPAINNQTTTTYTFTPNAGQCVTTTPVTMTVTVTPVTTTPTSQTACGSYTWPANGVTYSASGTYSFVTGCETKILTLTINQPSSSTSSANVCATSLPYVWNGTNYNASGSYTKVFAAGNSVGCDSIAILNLTVNTTPATPTFTQVAAICAGGTITLPSTSINGVSGGWSPAINNQNTTTYTFTPDAGQCVSSTVVTMTVTVNYPTFTSTTDSAVGSYTWSSNNQPYYTSGTYINPTACGGADTLHLKILAAKTGMIVYPNPTKSGIVTINWANANIKVGTKVQVIVYDRIGRVVSRKTETVPSLVEDRVDLKLKGYSNGLYVVTLEVLYTNYKYSEKIIKQDRD